MSSKINWKNREEVLAYRREYRKLNKSPEENKRWNTSKNNKCLDCGVLINNNSTRCRKCSINNQIQNKDAKENAICPHCNKLFEYYKSRKKIYCSQKCYLEERIPYNKGKKIEEVYGEEKAKEIREMLKNRDQKGEKNPMYGNHHSEETKQKIREKAIGRKRSLEVRNQMSESRTGAKNNFYGRHHTEKTKELLRKRLQNKTYEELYGGEKANKIKKKLSKSETGRVHSEKTKKRISAGHQGISLEEWKEFISCDPYTPDFNKQFKEKIKERDGCCMLCNIGFEDLKLLNRVVSIHHIDYNKLNSFPQNCISLCKNCHSITNGNRNHWTKFFQSLLSERYNYEYSEDQKIVLDFTKGDK